MGSALPFPRPPATTAERPAPPPAPAALVGSALYWATLIAGGGLLGGGLLGWTAFAIARGIVLGLGR